MRANSFPQTVGKNGRLSAPEDQPLEAYMKLVVTIDVEEEGLFSGHYNSHHAPVSNVSKLTLLDPIFRDWGIRPTLMLSYQVVRAKQHHDLILQLSDKWKGEIGAHLHPWNTPPLAASSQGKLVPSEMMSREILTDKLKTLMEALRAMGVDPYSFRMGRFNMGPKMFSILEETQIQVDSSIAPMRRQFGGPAHLLAPTDPYFPDPKDPSSPGESRILEAPVTIVPLIPKLRVAFDRLEKAHLLPPSLVSWFFKYLGSLPLQPVWTGLTRLKAGTNLHHRRGGGVVTIFFHSSELMPEGSPHHPTEAHVKGFLARLSRFFSWLYREMSIRSLTLSELYGLYQQGSSATNSETMEYAAR